MEFSFTLQDTGHLGSPEILFPILVNEYNLSSVQFFALPCWTRGMDRERTLAKH